LSENSRIVKNDYKLFERQSGGKRAIDTIDPSPYKIQFKAKVRKVHSLLMIFSGFCVHSLALYLFSSLPCARQSLLNINLPTLTSITLITVYTMIIVGERGKKRKQIWSALCTWLSLSIHKQQRTEQSLSPSLSPHYRYQIVNIFATLLYV